MNYLDKNSNIWLYTNCVVNNYNNVNLVPNIYIYIYWTKYKNLHDLNNQFLIKNRRLHIDELIKFMPYEEKLEWAKKRIKEFLDFTYNEYKNNPKYKHLKPNDYKVIISFSGGKDSTVLLDLINIVHKEIKSKIYLQPAYAYEITFPETLVFIKNTIKNYQKENKYILDLMVAKPKLPWNQILETKGYPIFSKQISVILNRIKKTKSKTGLTRWIFGIDTAKFKLAKSRLFLLDNSMANFTNGVDEETLLEFNDYFKKTLFFNDYLYSEKCCDYVKGGLKHNKLPCFVGTMASESQLRRKSWIHNGCNILSGNKILSRPLSLFQSNDIWKYIYKNKIKINKMYGFKPRASNLEKSVSKLRYQRLGCISCPYGAHLEKNTKNRFQILYHESQQLYYAQVIATGMYKVLIDMDIEIQEDELYMKLYRIRHEQIKNWYDNFEHNLCKVICDIENRNNYKGYKPIKNKQVSWEYSFDEIKQIYQNYGLNIEDEKLKMIVDQTRK